MRRQKKERGKQKCYVNERIFNYKNLVNSNKNKEAY